MAFDISGIANFAPLSMFLLVVVVVYTILAKSELLSSSKYFNVFIGFLIATIFFSLIDERSISNAGFFDSTILLGCAFLVGWILVKK